MPELSNASLLSSTEAQGSSNLIYILKTLQVRAVPLAVDLSLKCCVHSVLPPSLAELLISKALCACQPIMPTLTCLMLRRTGCSWIVQPDLSA